MTVAKYSASGLSLTPAESLPASVRHPVASFVVRRVLAGLVTLILASILIFVATNILPGNTVEVLLGRAAGHAALHKLENSLGLDHPAVERYLTWFGGFVHGNFGKSGVALVEGRPGGIVATLASPLADSAILAGLTALLLIPLTMLFGLAAGVHAGRKTDNAISLSALVAGGLPEFVTGTVMIFFFFSVFKVLPPTSLLIPGESPFSNLRGLVLPVFTLLAVALGAGVRQVRAGVAQVLQEDYVRFARLNGVSERRVLWRYALRNALAPSVQITAQNLQYLVGGIIIVESVFAYPGIGTYLVNAVTTRTFNEVEAASMILATLYITINILADLVVRFLVPRLRTSAA